MLATLITDASHCPKTGAAGFGFWCVSDRGKLAGGKPLNGAIKDSYEAEAKGVANSLVIGLRSGIIQQGDTVIIQLDNISVVYGINGKLRKKRKDIKEILDFIRNFKIENNLKIECRHVKGHSKKTENRYSANKHCDKRAKEQMKIYRSELSK
ncbi:MULTISPECIES: reverse transcriptase-like protein [Enterobacteriaceae]|uniref:reverse transcriptase-like protein n=1 Tax=Enterobacteriaceae TaxID=543 RepID=UPI002E2C323E|nr:reverse transcriptase-like protein [Klebsiella pneumoniae]MED6004898.1 reverse transcriptase-like protein [Klebsiella pneumoniae]MED6058288.1 reverse transcriptase-like protein [Klebsiella pneumoniae]